MRVAHLDAASSLSPTIASPAPQTMLGQEWRVYVPYSVSFDEAAVFWFGHVTPEANYTDVRLITTADDLRLALRTFDRRLWYDTSPAPGTLADWDAVSLYLNLDGAIGEVPGDGSYRFDVQLDWGWENHTDFQAAYQGDGGQWVLASVPFTATTGWIGDAPNSEEDDRGWLAYYTIPFTSLGLSGPPPQNTVWGFSIVVHDRDSAAGPPLAVQTWPETMTPLRPASWGQFNFGLKPSYVPESVLPRETAVIRHGLSGAEVIDAAVGGSNLCGAAAGSDYFSNWGELNYAGEEFLNIQRVEQQMDWPCDSRVYVTFPLDSLPEGKEVLSATLTLYQFGNAGEGWYPGPQPSFIQVFTVYEDWQESTLTWNNAPLAGDYIAATWVDPLDETPPWPGIPRHWDVSGAVAEAHDAGEPLRLALYSPDWPMNSGKYFYSSDIGGGGEGRPTLSVLWGDLAPDLTKSVSPTSGVFNDAITYTLGIRGDGQSLTLTDTLPSGLGAVTILEWIGTSNLPTYDSGQHRLTWSDSPTAGQAVTLTYSAPIEMHVPAALINTAVLQGAEGFAKEAFATVLVNPLRVYLPVVLKNR